MVYCIKKKFDAHFTPDDECQEIILSLPNSIPFFLISSTLMVCVSVLISTLVLTSTPLYSQLEHSIDPSDLPDQFIVVLGIAQDAGYPQAACQKKCCQAFWEGKYKEQFTSCLGIVDQSTGKEWLSDYNGKVVSYGE